MLKPRGKKCFNTSSAFRMMQDCLDIFLLDLIHLFYFNVDFN